jgi:molybdenum cofactor sulfurtransferase
VFTANASGALKLVAESYPFAPGGTFLLTYDNHNSVNGIREFARARGAQVAYAPVRPPDMRIEDDALGRALDAPSRGARRLFAFPAQSNFSGVLHPLAWVDRAKERGWDVLLDAAAYAPTHALDLGAVRPDFVTLSFYKMFGYPTGVGALLARREALTELRRPWFAGGTIAYASVSEPRHDLHEGAEAFEDGTLNYLALPAVEAGLRRLANGRQAAIDARVMALTGWTLERLAALRHANGRPLVQLYGPLDTIDRGGAIAFNLQGADGALIDHREVERAANGERISLRTGCFCNPGAGEAALGISEAANWPVASVHERADDARRPSAAASATRGAGRCGCRSGTRAPSWTPSRSCDCSRGSSPRRGRARAQRTCAFCERARSANAHVRRPRQRRDPRQPPDGVSCRVVMQVGLSPWVVTRPTVR